eukprot:11176685-Lingulodinium_polyedra.AAC.1
MAGTPRFMQALAPCRPSSNGMMPPFSTSRTTARPQRSSSFARLSSRSTALWKTRSKSHERSTRTMTNFGWGHKIAFSMKSRAHGT